MNRTSNGWVNKMYAQCFDFETITFEKAVSMFEPMEISELFYESVVEPYYKN